VLAARQPYASQIAHVLRAPVRRRRVDDDHDQKPAEAAGKAGHVRDGCLSAHLAGCDLSPAMAPTTFCHSVCRCDATMICASLSQCFLIWFGATDFRRQSESADSTGGQSVRSLTFASPIPMLLVADRLDVNLGGRERPSGVASADSTTTAPSEVSDSGDDSTQDDALSSHITGVSAGQDAVAQALALNGTNVSEQSGSAATSSPLAPPETTSLIIDRCASFWVWDVRASVHDSAVLNWNVYLYGEMTM
jgi:hypothetical protein